MQSNVQRTASRHLRLATYQTAKGRTSFATAALSIISCAGVGGAATGALEAKASEPASPNISQVADFDSSVGDPDIPQILTFSEVKTPGDVASQITKAQQVNKTRLEADSEVRANPLAQQKVQFNPVDLVNGLTENLDEAIHAIVRPAEGLLTSGFGPRWGSFHYGIDIANAPGTPIYSVMSGTVIDSGPAFGFGNWIRVLHDDGSVSVYGHMSKLLAQVGQHVEAGEEIALMGSEGIGTGCHLHFEIHPDGTTPVDPLQWLLERGINY